MKKIKKRILAIVCSSFVFVACSSKDDEQSKDKTANNKMSTTEGFILPSKSLTQPDTNRWYTQNQVKNGEITFGQICAACHQKDASGSENWKESKGGVFPPPPLNGQAHAWHHPLTQLHKTIKEGTTSLGGNMPAWGKVLDDEKILETIAFFQSKWSDDIYSIWSGNKPSH
ncbi:MAG: cytochrome c [Saccharospirillaceae bacterium]|nr:cytochrome c [Pseudomonadales bacterium]NRB79718.1 cytochrome c [Saccharospirillaceae bacterium]